VEEEEGDGEESVGRTDGGGRGGRLVGWLVGRSVGWVFARTHPAAKLQRAKIELAVNEVRFTARSRCVFLFLGYKA